MFEPPVSTPTARMTAIARVAKLLVGLVGEGHLRRDGDRVAGVDAHRVEVLDRADDHDVVGAVADDLELELVPAAQGLLDEHLADRTRREPELDLARRSSDWRVTNPPPWPPSVNAGRTTAGTPTPSSCASVGDDRRLRDLQAARLDRLLEELAVLGARDRVDAGADQLDPELVEDARPRASSSARLSAVWPPIVGSSASGRSRRSTPATPSRSSGSR